MDAEKRRRLLVANLEAMEAMSRMQAFADIRRRHCDCSRHPTVLDIPSHSKSTDALALALQDSLGAAYHESLGNNDPHSQTSAADSKLSPTKGKRLYPSTISHHPIEVTRDKPWRYFTVFECTGLNGSARPEAAPTHGEHSQRNHTSPSLCLTFKAGRLDGDVRYAVSSDGIDFKLQNVSVFSPFPEFRFERDMAHNFAVVRIATDHYMIAGGMGPGRDNKGRNLSSMPAIRLLRGRGWPIERPNWKLLPSFISASEPANCVDRRASRIPSRDIALWQRKGKVLGNLLCEFDGRLSLVRMPDSRGRDGRGSARASSAHKVKSPKSPSPSTSPAEGAAKQPRQSASAPPVLRLYARANLDAGRQVGGRFVQTTWSADGGATWESWRPVQICDMPPLSVDIYFFHVQINPVDPTSLLALFPISLPPYACIGIAFSYDGVVFSAPSRLLSSMIGWRTAYDDYTGMIEWRNEDHPVAGVVSRQHEVWFYIHHAVNEQSMRMRALTGKDSEPLVVRYAMRRAQLVAISKHHLETTRNASTRPRKSQEDSADLVLDECTLPELVFC
mmetsp:Transcript_13303/g.25847  ORF Transcript_13303/g.25847 Transcript_13303/m.25847 type:complete len:560 (+) Transcript_13303:94-1773(+)